MNILWKLALVYWSELYFGPHPWVMWCLSLLSGTHCRLSKQRRDEGFCLSDVTFFLPLLREFWPILSTQSKDFDPAHSHKLLFLFSPPMIFSSKCSCFKILTNPIIWNNKNWLLLPAWKNKKALLCWLLLDTKKSWSQCRPLHFLSSDLRQKIIYITACPWTPELNTLFNWFISSFWPQAT